MATDHDNQRDIFAQPGIVPEAAISTATGTLNPFEAPSAADTEDFGTFKEAPGQRQLPHPETLKRTWFTRASKFASTISDQYMLNEWKIAMAVLGVCSRRDLYALGASFRRPEDWESGWWRPMAELGHKGMDAAQSSAGAHEGTAIHSFTESVDKGEMRVKDVPAEWRPHVQEYLRLHTARGFAITHVESLILNLSVHRGVCGRLDRLRQCPDGYLIVDDLKTGKNAPMGLDEIAIQLSVYANAEWIFDPATGLYERMPENVRKDVAMITHVPLDDPSKAELIPIDIEKGWRGAQLAADVREYRNSAKRKRDGIRLDPAALDFEPTVTVVGVESLPTAADWTARLYAAETLAELSGIFTEAWPLGAWTPELDELGARRKAEIKGQIPRLRSITAE